MISLFSSYIKWHYGRAYIELAHICRNYFSFIYNFFSIPILSKTLFSRWEMLGESYKKGIHIGETLSTFLLNMIMRFFGFIVRSVVILLGFASIFVFFIIAILVFIFWTLLPFIISILLVSGIRLIVN